MRVSRAERWQAVVKVSDRLEVRFRI